MITPSLRLRAVISMLVLLALPVVQAFDERTWLTSDGQLIDATFVRLSGDTAELRTRDGRLQRVPKAALSIGDLDYLKASAPQEKKPAVGSKPPVAKIPNPAKSAKVDRKQFKPDAGEMKVTARSYKIFETPHFKILYLPPAEPADLAELAERLWIDTAFFHGNFIEKWRGRKMAIIMVNDDAAFTEAMLWNGAGGEGALVDRAGPEGAGGVLQIPAAEAESAGIFNHLRILRGCAAPQAGKKPQPLKGVWDPFRTHCVAEALLEVQAGGVSAFAEDGQVAIFTGHAFYKEIQLTGKVGTNLLTGPTKYVSSVKGFARIVGKEWASELKMRIRKGGEWKPHLAALFNAKHRQISDPDIVFSYGFCRFLQSTSERLTAFNKLCRKIDASHQVPGLDEIGQLYGYDDGKALEKAWIAWMDGPEFR